MAQESNNVRRCGQIGDGEDDELSMVDVLNEQARLQADAKAVLGGSDANNCTYPQGYLKRQALYACATCTPNGNAGICLACSYTCHEGHDLYELYTKRFFACDCGNEKFGGQECKLLKEKKELNARNHYNQNFKGAYCTCARPYPDPDDTIEDEMMQCIMCEDWYHGRHLKTSIPESDDFQEMTCPGCMSKYPFLWAYNIVSPVTLVTQKDNETEQVDISTNFEVDISQPSSKSNGLVIREQAECDNASQESKTSDQNKSSQPKETNEEPPAKKVKLENVKSEEKVPENSNGTAEVNDEKIEHCILRSLQKRDVKHSDCAAFWPEGWRSKLCQCPNCLFMYKDREIEFLIDEEDTVHAYEEKGRNFQNDTSEEESEASALAQMNHIQQIEVVRGFMDLKTELNGFLQQFARDGKVVTEADIREFFQRMNRRRQQDRAFIPQHTCR